MTVLHEGFNCQISDNDRGEYSLPVVLDGNIVAFAKFDEGAYWHYEHSTFLAIPFDFSPYGLSGLGCDGPSAFEAGEVSFDTQLGIYILSRNEEPSFGGRYIRLDGNMSVADRFELPGYPWAVFYQLLGA